jgi:4-amino-4-deoxy-L-arabinose transferase-like glycosyltransferase
VYLATRIYFAARFPYFVDEGTYGVFVERGADTWKELYTSLTIGREPLEIWIAIPFTKWAGLNPMDALRAASIVSGLATVPVMWLLGREIAGNAVGVVAAALYVLLPFFLVHNGIGIMESLVTLVVAAALLLQIKLARRPDLRLGLLLGIVFAAAILTKENTKPALALVPLSLLLFDWSPEGRRERLKTWVGAVAIAFAFAIAANVSMHLSKYWPDLVRARDSPFYTVRSFSSLVDMPFWSFPRAWHAYRPALLEYVTVPVFAASIAGAVLLLRRNRNLAALLLIWVLLPLAISFALTVLPFPRHVMYLTPPLLVFAGIAVVALWRWAAGRFGPPRAAAALTAAGVLALAQAVLLDARVLNDPVAAHYPGLDEWQYVTGTGGGEPWPKLERDMLRRAGDGQVIVITPTTDGNVIHLMLYDNPRFVFVKGTDPRAQTADFAITDENPLPDFQALAILRNGHYKRIGRYQRPYGGKVVKLYEREPRL